jgi:hypothetical protein
MIVSAIDPGFRNLATVSVLWTPKHKRVQYAKTIHTLPEMSDALSWTTITGAIAEFAHRSVVDLRLVRTQSVNAALGIKPPRRGTMPDYQRSKAQKAATRAVVTRLLSGAEDLDEHQIDACGIAIAAALGKGVVA